MNDLVGFALVALIFLVVIGLVAVATKFFIARVSWGSAARQKKLLRLRTRFDDTPWEEPAIPVRQPEPSIPPLKLARKKGEQPPANENDVPREP